MSRRRLARGALCVAAACLLGASDAPRPALRRDADAAMERLRAGARTAGEGR